MKKELWERLLHTEDRDPGCDAGFAVLDQYVEAVLHGGDAAELFPEMTIHLKQCAACREDTEGLLDAMRKNLSADS